MFYLLAHGSWLLGSAVLVVQGLAGRGSPGVYLKIGNTNFRATLDLGFRSMRKLTHEKKSGIL
jgi:hypothetical protein